MYQVYFLISSCKSYSLFIFVVSLAHIQVSLSFSDHESSCGHVTKVLFLLMFFLRKLSVHIKLNALPSSSIVRHIGIVIYYRHTRGLVHEFVYGYPQSNVACSFYLPLPLIPTPLPLPLPWAHAQSVPINSICSSFRQP